MDAPMAGALGGEDLQAAADLAVGVVAAVTPAETAESLATAAAVLGASAPAAGEGVGGAVVAATAAPPSGLFGPHFLLRAASHLVYVTFTAAILFQVYDLGWIAPLFSLLWSTSCSALAPSLTYLSLVHTSSPMGTAHAYRLARVVVLHAVTVAVTGILSFYLTPFSAGHLPLVARAVAVAALFAAGGRPPESPIAYAAGHSMLRVPVSWLATALSPHVGEVEEALAAARTYYAGARRFVKAVAVAALTALASMDEDSDSDGGRGDGDGGGDGGGHGVAADAAGAGGDAGATRHRSLRVPLEGAYYVEATPAWATAVAAEERRRAKDAAARRPAGTLDADVWTAAGTEGPGRPLAESPAVRMRRRGLRRATPSVAGRSGGPGLLAGALGDGEGMSSSKSVGVATDAAAVAVRRRASGIGSGSSGSGDRSLGASSSAGVATVMGAPDRPRPRRSERAMDKMSDTASAALTAGRPRRWVRGASSDAAVAAAMDSGQRPRVVQSNSDGVAAVLNTRGRAVSERRYGPDGARLTGRAAEEQAKEMENLGAYRLVPPTLPGPGGPRRAASPRRLSVGAVEVSTRLAGVDDAYAELRALRASFRRPRLLGGTGGDGGAGASGANDESLMAPPVSPSASVASSPVTSGPPPSPGAGTGRPRSGAPGGGRRPPPSSVGL